jgi:hypothetical protein
MISYSAQHGSSTNAHKAPHKQNSFRHYDYGECRHNIKALDRNKPLREWVKEQCPEN